MGKAVNVHSMVLAGLFAALMAICAWISVPVLETAFTLQTFGVLLALGVLGGKWGTAAIVIYLLLGTAGLPVFSGFRGGPGVLLGATGGYLLGFLFSGLVYWLVTAALGENRQVRLTAMVLGLLVCYVFGSGWFTVLYGGRDGAGSLGAVMMICVVPYLIPDICKLALAHILSERLRRQMRRG